MASACENPPSDATGVRSRWAGPRPREMDGFDIVPELSDGRRMTDKPDTDRWYCAPEHTASCAFFDSRYNVLSSGAKGDRYHLTGSASPPDPPPNRAPRFLTCRVPRLQSFLGIPSGPQHCSPLIAARR